MSDGLRLNITTNFPEVVQRLRALGDQAANVAAVELSRTAWEVRAAIKAEMSRAFDRPTQYTLNGILVKPATRNSLEARVWLKDQGSAGKGTPADRFLGPQVFGGVRRQKGLEKALQATGLMAAGYVAVPAEGAQLDGNGNVKRSQIVQILSQLKVQQRAGYESRRSNSGASRRAVSRQGVTYFALPAATRGLKPGIYLKRKFGHGSAIRPVFIFTSQAQYQPRLKFFEVAEATVAERLPINVNKGIEKAIERARLR